MTAVIAGKIGTALVATGAAMMLTVGAHAAGPQIMMYVTVPLDGHSHSHVFGLRLDKATIASTPDIRTIDPTSTLNRRALLDLQLGADSALRLELDRRLTWDFNRQQWRESSLPATFTLRIPTPEKAASHEVPAAAVAAAARLADLSTLNASLMSPFQQLGGKLAVKSLTTAP